MYADLWLSNPRLIADLLIWYSGLRAPHRDRCCGCACRAPWERQCAAGTSGKAAQPAPIKRRAQAGPCPASQESIHRCPSSWALPLCAGDDAVLPRARPALHAFGHDHSNLFVSEAEPGSGVRYVAVFKSGEPPASYDAAYYPGASGYTPLTVRRRRAPPRAAAARCRRALPPRAAAAPCVLCHGAEMSARAACGRHRRLLDVTHV